MEWYYTEGDRRVGPVTEEEFRGLVASGTVADSTLVWQSGMADWVAYGTVRTAPPPPAESGGIPGYVTCVECGQSFPQDEVIQYLGSNVCASCKPVFFQRVKEGGDLPGEFVYGGFWIRFAAKILDGIITSVPTYAVMIPLGVLTTGGDEAAVAIMGFVYVLVAYGIPIAYSTFFVGRFGATPGKMAAGLKIVRPDGERITYLRAFGRYFGEILSAFTLMIGYIMAAFDGEKRALHDRVCDTRVVRSR